ncbi:EscU/YscU/HrcU family type III secretion system export apparatus switch protein [Opitutus sp. ER46]|uniref:EscU/YscU/HrcU family type III secretion system export apparatus switch protein n=1 Tax=Opitutus sp. ER46 TaxID=2161864 RepID=UPI000D2FD7A3|nr:EscU/YscU/HrcU family type III secretion system export apparatus switch protein [Opitutus sp. ER46]PTX90911.1 type III secretion protein [Opitutus sp. ER46]
MADHDQDSKTEEPTEKRLNEAHDRGQFARSAELAVLFPIGALLGVFTMLIPTMSREVAEYSVAIFTRFTSTPISIDTVSGMLAEMLLLSARVLGPVLLAILGAIFLACGVQSGFRLTPEAVTFKIEQLNVIANFNRIFSKAAFVRTGIDILKLTAIGTALWLGTRGLIYDPLFTAPVEAAYLGEFLNRATVLFLTRLLLALGVVAAISYAYEKFKTHRDMMMTREEVKEEHKQSEGDGRVKGAMRRMARRLMQKQMLADVATADVVVTNPTHFAVALKYERGKDKAPVILAKGENGFAKRIKAIAAENGVPMVENKPVARLLFAMGTVGEAIPSELYQAVAEILAVVYRTHRYYFHRLKARRMEAGA